MGSFLSEPLVLQPVQTPLIAAYKSNRLSNIRESLSIFREARFINSPGLTSEQFDVCFGHWMGDCQPHFILWRSKPSANSTADAFTVFAGSIVHCHRARILDRIALLLDVFDFNLSRDLSRDELHICITSSIRGMLKLAGKPTWELKGWQVADLVDSSFNACDVDKDDRISIDEFVQWINHEQTIIDYLVEFAYGSDMDKCIRRRDSLLQTSMREFKDSMDLLGNVNLSDAIKIAKRVLFPALNDLSDGDAEKIGQYMEDFVYKELTSADAFQSIMTSIISFVICDQNGDSELDSKELGNLLWLSHGCEPTQQRVQFERTQLGLTNNDMQIKLVNWIEHISVSSRVDTILYTEFHRQEAASSGNGKIHFKELEIVLCKSLFLLIGGPACINSSGQEFIENAAHSMAIEICQKITFTETDSGTPALSWANMKAAMNSFGSAKFVQLAEFAMTEHCNNAMRYIHFDVNETATIDVKEIEAALFQRMAPFVANGRISLSIAHRAARQTSVKLLRRIDMDRDGQLDIFELKAMSNVIDDIERDMLADVLRPADPIKLLSRLRRANRLGMSLHQAAKKVSFHQETGTSEQPRSESAREPTAVPSPVAIDDIREAIQQTQIEIGPGKTQSAPSSARSPRHKKKQSKKPARPHSTPKSRTRNVSEAIADQNRANRDALAGTYSPRASPTASDTPKQKVRHVQPAAPIVVKRKVQPLPQAFPTSKLRVVYGQEPEAAFGKAPTPRSSGTIV